MEAGGLGGGCWILDARYWIVHSRALVFWPRSYLYDAGFCKTITGLSIQYLVSSI